MGNATKRVATQLVKPYKRIIQRLTIKRIRRGKIVVGRKTSPTDGPQRLQQAQKSIIEHK
jgi:hypothetical protein